MWKLPKFHTYFSIETFPKVIQLKDAKVMQLKDAKLNNWQLIDPSAVTTGKMSEKTEKNAIFCIFGPLILFICFYGLIDMVLKKLICFLHYMDKTWISSLSTVSLSLYVSKLFWSRQHKRPCILQWLFTYSPILIPLDSYWKWLQVFKHVHQWTKMVGIFSQCYWLFKD